MVVSTLAVPYRDTRAAALGWSLDAAEQPAFAVLDVPTPAAGPVHLRVLGASHQVVLRGSDGSARLTETVACLPQPLPPLPATVNAVRGDLRYDLCSEVVETSAAGFAAEVDALLERYGPDRGGLIGRFPGDPRAVTVLWVDLGAPIRTPNTLARWRTWHAYPRHRQIVRTTTVVRVGEKGGEPCAG